MEAVDRCVIGTTMPYAGLFHPLACLGACSPSAYLDDLWWRRVTGGIVNSRRHCARPDLRRFVPPIQTTISFMSLFTTEETNMATTRTARAHWEGSLMEGAGQVTLESSGVGTFHVSWPSRAEQANGKTSPEELLGAAHATCFSMALSNALAKAGTPPTSIDTWADVTFQPGTGITGIV